MELRSSLKREEAYAHAYLSVEVTSLAAGACVRWKLGANKPKEALREALAGLRIQGLKPSGSEKPLRLAVVKERRDLFATALVGTWRSSVCQRKASNFAQCLFQNGR